MNGLQASDFWISQQLTGLFGTAALRDQIVFGLAEILPWLMAASAVWVLLSGRTNRQRRHNQEAVVLAGVAVVLAWGIRWLIGSAVNRPRPFVTHPDLHHLALAGTINNVSFPSQHTFLLFTFAGTIFFLGYHQWWGRLLLVGASVVAIARVAAGVHYASDVIGGAAFGLLVAWVVVWTRRWVERQMR